MSIDRHTLRWNGWGLASRDFELGDQAQAIWDWLRAELGLKAFCRCRAVELDDAELRPSRLPPGVLAELREAVGEQGVYVDRFERAMHARGRSYCDLIHLRRGDLSTAPDAVVYPRNPQDVQAVVALAHQQDCALIPYGGGSSVVGGVTAVAGPGHQAVITVDTTRLDRVLRVDPTSLTADIEAGIYGPALERDLGDRGFTLGHFPQSFEFSTLGGWIAARGAGQQSNRYGRAEDWLVAAQLATPSGTWRTESFPATAAGPNLNDLVAGCEGRLGIITSARVRVHPVVEARDYRGYVFHSYERGVAAVREISQRGLPVAMLRLSDGDETHFLGTFSRLRKPPGAAARLAAGALAAVGFGRGKAMLLVGVEGDRHNVRAAVSRSSSIIRRHLGVPLGTSVGRSWFKSRFAMPYLRDPLLDRGVGVDTLETSTHWSNIERLYQAVRGALSSSLAEHRVGDTRSLVMCHISHCYEDGASLYFTFLFPQSDQPIEQWTAIKHAACQAIVDHGGTISHHHGVGTDHAAWLKHDKGDLGLSVLGALHRQLDPKGILNPGKMLASQP